MLFILFALNIATSTASNVQGEQYERGNIVPVISAFIQFAGFIPDDTLTLTDITDTSFQPEFFTRINNHANITIEISDTYTRISNAENTSIHTVKLKEKPTGVKDPPFKPLLYLDIHSDIPSSSGANIRVLNEWQRSDLILYHYKGESWHPLETRIDGNFIEAVTDSFSIFAVGAPGGINVRFMADPLILTGDAVTVSGAAYYNNSTAAAGINIEIITSWSGSRNITSDAQGNFFEILNSTNLPGNYSLWVNASSGGLTGTNSTTVQVTNTSLYRTNSSAVIANTTMVNPFTSISFSFPENAVPEVSSISLTLDHATSLNVKINNITLYNASTDRIELNLTGYIAQQNDINITTGSPVNLTYTLAPVFHITGIAKVTGYPGYYIADLNLTNGMSYDWKNSSILFHLSEGAYNVSVWENGSNITGSTIISGNRLRIRNSGIGTIFNNSIRNLKAIYGLSRLFINISANPEELEKGESVTIKADTYFNGTSVATTTKIIIYRDSVPVYQINVSSGTPFVYSNTIAGVYNITAFTSANIDGVERTGWNRTFIHIKDLLLYAIADPALSGRQINVAGRAYFTNNTGYEGRIGMIIGNESYSTTSNAAGYFNYSMPGRESGTYIISLNASAGSSAASANINAEVLEKYFYLIRGDLPEIKGDATLAPDALLWINQTNITRASLYLYCKTAIHLIFNPLPIAHKLIPANLNSNISGTFNLPLYPYDYLEILSAFVNTTAEDPVNFVEDMAFNLTIDGREVNSSIIPHGDPYFGQSDNIKDFIPGIFKPGNLQTVKVFNKNTGSSQQYYFTEEIYVDYIGHISSPCDLFIHANDNFTYANIGNFTNATVDITGFRAASNLIRMNNCRRTSIIGYNLSLQKQYFGFTTHSVIEGTSRYNITETALFVPGSNLTNVTVIMPLVERAKDIQVFINGTNVTESAAIGENLELVLSEVNSAKVINITYWTPILDITPSVNNSQFNQGDTVQIKADVTYLAANVSDAVVYANVTKAGASVANLTLSFAYGGTYLADLALSSGVGIYNVTVWAYNATTAQDSENTMFRVSGLNITVNAGGPYTVDTSATIAGYVRDLENNSNISAATVNITIWNGTFSNSTTTSTNSTGYYSLSRGVDAAGDYNVTVMAAYGNIRGTANTGYRVKYNVNMPLLPSYIRNSSVAVNITVYDRSLAPVDGAIVNSTVTAGGAYYYYNGATDGNGKYSFNFTDTSMLGYYNITVNISKAGVIGNATGSFRVSSLSITEYTDRIEYNAGDMVTVQGAIRDNEVNDYINNGTYNISIYSSSGLAAFRQGNISYRLNSSGRSLYDEDTFEAAVEWSGRDYFTPVRDSSTAFSGSYSLRMTWPGTTGWGGRNFEGGTGLESGQTSAGYSTDTYPYMSMAYRISSGDIINMLILVNGAWRSVALTQGSSTGGSYPTVAAWGNLSADDKWHWTQINLDEQLDASMGTGNHQITGVIWYPNTNIASSLTGEFWIDDFRISDKSLTVVSYNETFSGLSASSYTAYVNATYGTITGNNVTQFNINYNINTGLSKTIYGIGEIVPVNITVLDTNNTPAIAEVSINITRPDAGTENLNGTAVNGYFNVSFINTTLEGDYIIAVHAQNSSTQAHGDAVNRNFRASGFTANVSTGRSPAIYKPGETVNISGALRDTLGSPRTADVIIRINSSAGEVANTTLYGRNGSYAWDCTLSGSSTAGWYIVTVNAVTPEGVTGSAVAQFEVQLNITVNSGTWYNPGDAVNITVLVRNGSIPQDAVVNMAVQKIEIWDEFQGTYFDTDKMNVTSPDCCLNLLNISQNEELIFSTMNLTPNNAWVGKAVQLNTTSLPSRFILDYEVSTGGNSSQLLARPTVGNATSQISLNILNYSNNAEDGYRVYINNSGNWALLYSKSELMDNRKSRFAIEYDTGTVRFYKNGEQFYQTGFILPANSFIKLNGYAMNPVNGSTAYLKFDNITMYNMSSPVLNQGTADGSAGYYTLNFTAGAIGLYRINAASGNSSSYTTFKVRTLNVSSVVYGPYNFNESTLSGNTIIPLMIHGTVTDTETRAGITGAVVNVTISQDGILRAYRNTSSASGTYILNFADDLNDTAVGIFNVSMGTNDSGILASNNTSFMAYTIDQSWADPYKDYRVPILLYNGSDIAGSWHFDEGSGGILSDSSGNRNTGTLNGFSVANPGFETANFMWGNGIENLVFDNTHSKSGSFSGKIVKPDAGEKTQFGSGNVNNNAGTTLPMPARQYRYGGCVYISGGANAEIFFFSWNSSSGNKYDGTYDVISTSVQNQWVCINGTTTNVNSGDNLFDIRVDNNGGGTVWFDEIIANPVESWTDGKYGYGLRFDGQDDHVNIGDNVVDTTRGFSVSAWVRPAEYKTTAWEIRIVTDRDLLNAFTLYQYGNSIGFGVWNETEGFSGISAGSALITGEWTQATATYDGINTIRLYVNGTLANSTQVSGRVRESMGALRIGGGEIAGGVRAFNGTIDDVKIFNRALSSSEIIDRFSSDHNHLEIGGNNQSANMSAVSFDLALPGGSTVSSAALYDIEGTIHPAAIVGMGNYVNVTFSRTLSAYEGKILYLYFERPAPEAPHSSAMSSLSAPYSVESGAVEGYRLTIAPDKNIYSAGETVILTSKLQNITGAPLVTVITTTVYYPNATVAQVNYSQTRANYSIPPLKGGFTAVTEATVYGITRKDSTVFNVGDLSVNVSAGRAVYNTLETAGINVVVTENDSITAADVTLKIFDPNNVKVFEETKNTKSYWTETSDTDFGAGTLLNVNVSGGSVMLATKANGRYYTSGSLTSRVYDGGSSMDWGKLQWSATIHPSDSITLFTRTSQNNITWSDWSQGVYDGDIQNSSRYIQYRADFATTNDTKTPVLEDVTIETAAQVNYIYTLPDSPLGSYAITASASKSGNAGYNATVIELDRFDITAAADRTVYSSPGTITVSGTTTHRGIGVNASVNITVKKNLAINPSFETDLDNNTEPDGWIFAGSPWNGTGIRDVISRTGGYSVKVWRSQANTTEGLWYYPNMYVISPGTSYTFSTWVKTDNIADGTVRLWVDWYNGTTRISMAINELKSIGSQDGWVRIQGSAVSPGNASNVRVHLVSGITGNVWFDDVNIEPENNPPVYTGTTISNTSYTIPFSLSGANSYIVYSNGSFAANGTLNRSAATMFTIRSLDVNASVAGQFKQGSGNVTITGYVADNITKMSVPNATVNINITYPDGSMKQYSNITNVKGYYTYDISTPGLAGIYNVNITAGDYQDVKGYAGTAFNIGLRPVLSPAAEYVNKGAGEVMALEVFEDSRTDDLEGSTSTWSYRTGTDGTIKGTSTLRHRSGEKSLRVDYDLAIGNEYMFLESGMGAVNVSDYRYITFWLYIPQPDAFNSVALVLENDPTGWSSDERIYGQDPVPGWNYYSFNVSTLGKDLSHNHYLTVLIDDDNGAGEVTGTGSLYIDDFRLIRGNPVAGAAVTINITKPDMGVQSYSTPSGVIDRGDGTYVLNYTNTSLYGTYSVNATVIEGTYSGISSTVFGADDLIVKSGTGGPYIVGDTLPVWGNVSSTIRDTAFDRNVSINLTYPNGSIRYYNSGTVQAAQSYTQSGTYGHSGFYNPQYINDGSTSTFAYTYSTGTYVQVTWTENKNISKVKAYYYSQYWPTAYKIQVLAPDGVTWVDKKVVSGYVASPISSPTIEDRIPMTMTKGVRIYYQASYYYYFYIYEIWAYGPEEYSFDKIPLPMSGNYTLNVSAADSYGVNGSAQQLKVPVRFLVSVSFDKISYEPKDTVTAYVRAFNGTGYEPDAAVTAQITYATNGSVIDTRTATMNSTGAANVSFTLPADYTSYNIKSSVSKNGITGNATGVIATSNLHIWTDKGEVQIGDPVWPENMAPEEYRNLTIKVGALDSAGMRRTGQNLTARIYYPNGTIYGTYSLSVTDKIYSTSVLFPGRNIPEGVYSIQLAEYPGIPGNFSVMKWGCARCHRDNSVYISGNYNIGHYGLTINHDNEETMAPSTFDLNHSHKTINNTCWMNHDASYGSKCNNCHTFESSSAPPTACKACHNSVDHSNEGYLNDTYGADIHANINKKPGGSWYNKTTSCESCHGTLNSTAKPRVPLCTNCHPNSSGSDMKVMPGGLRGSNKTLEDFEDVSDIIVSAGYRYSTVSITKDAFNHSGSYSGKVDYGFGPGYGRVYIDVRNLDLTNASKISLWVYGDNSGTRMYVSLNNTKSTKISWHQSAPIPINWNGWRSVSVNIPELSQHDLMYITHADTVRIKLESDSETGYGSTIFIDELKKVAVGSHTQFDEVECGLCHGGRHDIKKAPDCQNCHQTQEHGWPQQDKYPGNNASCMECHQADVIENRINISNISEHTELLEDFENISLFTSSLTNFNRSDVYYGGTLKDDGNHSARLNYSGLTGYKGSSINVTSAKKFKGISVFVNASNDPSTRLVLGVYTTKWNNYSVPMDWNGWRQFNVLYHNVTVNETVSFNATGTVSSIWLGVYGSSSTGAVYIDDLRQAISDDYHQYESWKCQNCHIQIKNLPGITDMTSPIVDCSLCHNLNEPHYKQFTRVCMDCHFDSRHGEVENGNFTNYEKASTCLKCHTVPHDFNQTHLETADCNKCHQQRIHGQNYLNVQYNRSKHLDCERCHGKTTAEAPLPMGLGSPRTTILRLSYTFNNESQCLYCHKDRIVAYEMHINASVDEANQTLVGSILNDSVCSACHGSKSLLNESDRDELTLIDPNREPHAPQIDGHGNVSCYKCHGHRPETLTLNYGSNCVGCHQNTGELTELMPGMLNDSRLSNVTNPGAYQLIVHPPQVTGHGNASCSNCHGHINSNLTYIGSAAFECASCHENESNIDPLLPFRLPNSTRSTITNPGGNPLYVVPPQVLGHGNTSCKECHEHAPSTFNGFDFISGTVCEDCHQNASRNASLIEDTIPNSNKTKVIDNNTVIAPQVAGHGLTACYECHSHSAERMVYYGGNNTDCIFCHFNESSKETLLRNGSAVISTQITPHQDMNCTECHGHTPSNMTWINDCRLCHQNATKAQLLGEIYGTGLNITSPQNNISAVQVPSLSHSNSGIAGRKWNKTTAYWVNHSDSCQYCHAISRNYSDHNPLGRASAIAGNNTRNSSLGGSYWCASCHFQGYSSGNVTYNDVVKIYLDAGLPVPPEITANSSYGSYVVSNDGVKYYTHGLPDYSDSSCASCHGHATNTTEFLHGVTVGTSGSECMNCHDRATGPLDDPDRYPAISNASFNRHQNLNISSGMNVLDNSDCSVCHYNISDMDSSNWTTPTRTCMECHISGNYSAPIIRNHRQGGLTIVTGAYCSTCHNNSINIYAYSLNASVSHYGTNSSLPVTVNQTALPRFGFSTQAEAESYNIPCTICHNPPNLSYGTPTSITSGHTRTAACNQCHVDNAAGDLHNSSLGMPVTFYCADCHKQYAGKYKAPNLTGTLHNSYSCSSSQNCHGADSNGNRQLDSLSDHNYDITRSSVNSLPKTGTVYLNSATSVSVPRGTIVTVTSQINDSYADSQSSASRVGGAEYYIGSTDPGSGKGTPMNAVDGMYDSVNAAWESVTGTIDTGSLSAGTYTVYVRGMDIGKQWSSVQSATLTVLPAKGYINGTVTRSGLPIAGATVSTMGASTTTDVNGNYSLMIESGTYDVTVIKRPEYYDNTTTGISVTPDNTTIQHFIITLKPTGNITGTVTDATA